MAADLVLYSNEPQQLANLANPIGKLLFDPKHCSRAYAAMNRIADCLPEDPAALRRTFNEFTSPYAFQQIGLLANSIGKAAGEPACLLAMRGLSDCIADPAVDLCLSDALSLAQMIKGFARLPNVIEYDAGRERIAGYLQSLNDEALDRFSTEEIMKLAKALSQASTHEGCRAAQAHLARYLASRLAQLNLTEIADATFAFSRMKDVPACASFCQSVASHLATNPKQIASGGIADINTLLGAFNQADRLDAVATFIEPCMNRIRARIKEDDLRSENLDTLGWLCYSLKPLFRTHDLRPYKAQGLTLLIDELMPIAKRKLDRYTAHKKEPATTLRDNIATRTPGKSGYLILSSYWHAIRGLGNRHIPGAKLEGGKRRQRRDAIADFLESATEKTLTMISAEPDERNINFIAAMESMDDPVVVGDACTRLRRGEHATAS